MDDSVRFTVNINFPFNIKLILIIKINYEN